MEPTFELYMVAVFNPKDGHVVVEPRPVAAISPESARNKAVALMCAEEVTIDAEGTQVSLDKALDTLRIVIRPFVL